MFDAVSRRQFLQAALAAGVAVPSSFSQLAQPLFAEETRRKSPNEKLNLAVIGVADRGAANRDAVAGENIVALCDIDEARLDEASAKYPGAKKFIDYREIFGMANLDGVVVSTPDHTHAIPVSMALSRKLPVYCEKPLTHSVYECRHLRNLAAKNGCITQMGTQIHAEQNYRRVVEMVQAGVIGPVRKVHVWQSNSIRPGQLIKDSQIPKGIHYDLWIGPAPFRPFHTSHFHFNWRFWWDFGGGTLADIGCHYMDLPFWALGLRAPLTVTAKGEKTYEGDNTVPNNMQVDYTFAARGDQPPVELTWYHGAWKPAGAEQYDKGAAILFEGDKGRLLADYGSRKVFLQEGKEPEMVPQTIPNSIGHHAEWIQAIKTGGQTTCNFDYSGGLAETVLLGNVAYRAAPETKLEWDAEGLTFKNTPAADQYIRREYRQGWSLDA